MTIRDLNLIYSKAPITVPKKSKAGRHPEARGEVRDNRDHGPGIGLAIGEIRGRQGERCQGFTSGGVVVRTHGQSLPLTPPIEKQSHKTRALT